MEFVKNPLNLALRTGPGPVWLRNYLPGLCDHYLLSFHINLSRHQVKYRTIGLVISMPLTMNSVHFLKVSFIVWMSVQIKLFENSFWLRLTI